MPPDLGVDWRLWLVAATAATSLLLSLYNTWRTGQNAKEAKANRNELQRIEAENKTRSIKLEEFRSSVRDPIRTAASELPPLVRRLAGVANTRTSIDQLINTIEELNGETFTAIGRVMDALGEANRSRFADGDDWADGIDRFEDAVAEAFNVALDSTQSHAARLAAVKDVGNQLTELQMTVNNRVDERLEQYAEASGVAPSSASGQIAPSFRC